MARPGGILALLVVGLLGGCAPQAGGRLPLWSIPLAQGDRYVSLGSSFAAGPGVASLADSPPNRCARSAANYAHQLAARRHLVLIDVACSGATTAHVLRPWAELPAQIDAVTADTRLVTVTIGGNDVSFVRNLIALACANVGKPPPGAPDGKCPSENVPTDEDWRSLETGLDQIAAEVRRRAPDARLVLIQYLKAVPTGAACAQVPIGPAGLDMLRSTQTRLAAVTAAVAARHDARVVDPATGAAPHDPCSAKPWIEGFPLPGSPGFVPFHPNYGGMTAISQALDKVLR